ncbi:hypothetical protein OV450_3835 [Actinobacteria bacterium OV450]|nr:hypothetical protein OV450_3835 [Actinobacteria bacterium OV450]
MTPSEAHELHAAMRHYGIPGAVTPAAPDDLDGAWLVVDEEDRNVTASVQARVSQARSRQPERGFVFVR